MDALLAARVQMALSLGFHMIFAALGVGMPLLMVLAEGRWLRTGETAYRQLAQTWAKATGILFAIGAVSGTALSFELGLLWPRFMGFAGTAIGPGFTMEGYAFFLEAIFLGLYLYGWERFSPRVHWLTGIPVAVSGMASSVVVVATDAWMQHPLGAEVLMTNPQAFDPIASLLQNPAWPVMAVHSTLATYAATGFAVAGVYGWGALRGQQQPIYAAGLSLAMLVGTVAAALMPITGHVSAADVARRQPVKLAAMEAQFATESGAPLRLGGWPDVANREVYFSLEIPGLLSWLAYGDTAAPVMGLEEVTEEDWPNVPLTHLSFQVMVVLGMVMLGVAGWYWLVAWRRGRAVMTDRRLMWTLVGCSSFGFLALEAGWIVTEVGRQPWIVYGVMRTAEAVTPAPGVPGTLVAFTLLYLLLSITLVALLRRIRHPEP